MSIFGSVSVASPDPIFGITAAFLEDPRPNKVNLGVGVYRTADLRVALLQTVQEAERLLLEQKVPRPYLPIEGDREFVGCVRELFLGVEEADARHLSGVQTVGATMALRLTAEFLHRMLGHKVVYLCDPTWANHKAIFQGAGLATETYPYYDRRTCCLAERAFLSGLRAIPEGSAVLFHACCHNPTGVDPTDEQWAQALEIVQARRLVPIFDCAYQGFGSGIEEDVQPIRRFFESRIPLFATYSCAKNFGLYAERTGALFVQTGSEQEAEAVQSQLKRIVRGMYSNPPVHGAHVVKTILGSERLRGEWVKEVESMRGRLHEMRKGFMAGLMAKTPNDDFHFLAKQRGLFSFCGLEREQVDRLQAEYGIYTPPNGRVNVSGLNSANLDYVVEAIASVL